MAVPAYRPGIIRVHPVQIRSQDGLLSDFRYQYYSTACGVSSQYSVYSIENPAMALSAKDAGDRLCFQKQLPRLPRQHISRNRHSGTNR